MDCEEVTKLFDNFSFFFFSFKDGNDESLERMAESWYSFSRCRLGGLQGIFIIVRSAYIPYYKRATLIPHSNRLSSTRLLNKTTNFQISLRYIYFDSLKTPIKIDPPFFLSCKITKSKRYMLSRILPCGNVQVEGKYSLPIEDTPLLKNGHARFLRVYVIPGPISRAWIRTGKAR